MSEIDQIISRDSHWMNLIYSQWKSSWRTKKQKIIRKMHTLALEEEISLLSNVTYDTYNDIINIYSLYTSRGKLMSFNDFKLMRISLDEVRNINL